MAIALHYEGRKRLRQGKRQRKETFIPSIPLLKGQKERLHQRKATKHQTNTFYSFASSTISKERSLFSAPIVKEIRIKVNHHLRL